VPRQSLFDRLEKESEAERKEWAARNAKTALESSQRAGTDYRAGGSELATSASAPAAAPAAKAAPPTGAPNFASVADAVRKIIAAHRDRYHAAVNTNVKMIARETNEELGRALARVNPAFNNEMDDYSEVVTGQAMNYCKVTPGVDRARWSQALKSFTGLMQGARGEVANIMNGLARLPEWTKTADLVVAALHAAIDKQFNQFSDAISGAIAKISATLVTYPYIMAKTRLQYKGTGNQPKYTGSLDVLQRVLVEEGFLALYAGLETQLLKSVLGTATLFMAKEKISSFTVKFLQWFAISHPAAA